MYAPESQVDRKCLRQGDIISAVPFPIIEADSVVLGKIESQTSIELPHPKIVTLPREHRTRNDCLTMQIKVRLAPCAIVSHCCELELRNGKRLLPMITVARIVLVKESVGRDPEKMRSLKANKDPRNQSDLGYLDYFYLEPDDAMERLEYVVDFSQLAPVPGTEYQNLLHRKMLQLSDRERAKFKIKLAAFLARLTDEESAAGFEKPWQSS